MPHLARLDPDEMSVLSGHRHMPPPLKYHSAHEQPPLWSATAGWQDLTRRATVPTKVQAGRGWPTAWTITYLRGEEVVDSTVAAVSVDELLMSNPIRTATWHPNATARAGLHFLASTAEHQPHESMFERNLLLAADFHGVGRVASQPFTLTWHDGAGGQHQHTPDFMIETGRTVTVINVRPEPLVKPKLLDDCWAVAEVCLHHDWQHALVVDYPRPPLTNIAEVAAHRSAQDPLGYGAHILSMLDENGPIRFTDLADAFEAPVIARAIIDRLIWHREASIDLNHLLNDDTLVWLAGEEPQS